jgi:Probable Zinc-ribbon domain
MRGTQAVACSKDWRNRRISAHALSIICARIPPRHLKSCPKARGSRSGGDAAGDPIIAGGPACPRALHGRGCAYCAGHRVSVTNSLATCCPQAAADLDPVLNGGLTAEQVTAGSNRVVTWSCPDGLGHTWQTTVGGRVAGLAAGRGSCPLCQPSGVSQRQLAVASALAHALPGLTVDSWPPAADAAGGLTSLSLSCVCSSSTTACTTTGAGRTTTPGSRPRCVPLGGLWSGCARSRCRCCVASGWRRQASLRR